MQLKSIR